MQIPHKYKKMYKNRSITIITHTNVKVITTKKHDTEIETREVTITNGCRILTLLITY